ncbi:MAG: hypothetical protein A4E58_00813 [Syntrophorhabdus sp. PtaB.Bin006]|nr:MAG: hypothetical protein A4E58_00813 [Syntrophorhabdus sp. PtaB.Bin006]
MADKDGKACGGDNHVRLPCLFAHDNRDKTLEDVPREGEDSRYLARSPHYVRSPDISASHVTRVLALLA